MNLKGALYLIPSCLIAVAVPIGLLLHHPARVTTPAPDSVTIAVTLDLPAFNGDVWVENNTAAAPAEQHPIPVRIPDGQIHFSTTAYGRPGDELRLNGKLPRAGEEHWLVEYDEGQPYSHATKVIVNGQEVAMNIIKMDHGHRPGLDLSVIVP